MKKVKMITMFSFVMILSFAVSGCGKDKKSGDGKSSNSISSDSIPTAAETAKWDCKKACDVQYECYKKGGIVKLPKNLKKNCVLGCTGFKTNYNPKILGKTARGFRPFTQGKCK